MAEHDKQSPDSSPPRAPSLDKSLTAAPNATPTETPLPSPPDSAERARVAAVALPQVLVKALSELEDRPLYPNEDYHKTFSLSWEEFKCAREEIEAAFRRFDYNPFKGEITIRMPTAIHDSFGGYFHDAFIDKLRPLKKGNTGTAKFVASITSMMSTDIALDNQRRPADLGNDVDKKEQKSPDYQYRHLESKYSGVVVEIVYSQQGKKLEKLAKAYIGGSKGGIKAKAEMTPKPNGLGSILKVKQDVNAVPFRDAHQQPLNSDHKLVLHLHDLAAKKDLLKNMEELRKKDIERAEESEGDSVELQISGSSDIEPLSTDDEQEEASKKMTKDDRPYPGRVREVVTGEPNVTTHSSSKRPADPNTNEHPTVAKRPKRRRG
ncbi:hypothetical protein H9Q74_008165 [Fusarium xylarioides]|nr:hypothetical protein H9Q71_006274 [Fusarium xylarioides]KAG5821560.1 hypothetical protein H9Q74_008165 [Fusarium xylarioides]